MKRIIEKKPLTTTDSNCCKETTRAKAVAKKMIIQHNVLACSDHKIEADEFDEAIAESVAGLKALGAQNTLQEMLIAQMTSIHKLQQKTIALASRIGNNYSNQFLANSAIKLSNCFTQQAALLAKLQGQGGQKIIVEHVEVHNGGKAIVGSFKGGTLGEASKK